MTVKDLPPPREECIKCPVYKLLTNYSDGLFVKNEVIAKMQQDIIMLKSGLRKVEKKVTEHEETLESLKADLTKCREENKKLKELVEKQEVVSNYFMQEFDKFKVSMKDLVEILRAQGFNVNIDLDTVPSNS